MLTGEDGFKEIPKLGAGKMRFLIFVFLMPLLTFSAEGKKVDNKTFQEFEKKFSKITFLHVKRKQDKKESEKFVRNVLNLNDQLSRYIKNYFETNKDSVFKSCKNFSSGDGLFTNNNTIRSLFNMRYCMDLSCTDYKFSFDETCLNFVYSFVPASLEYYLYVPSDLDSYDGWDGLSLNELFRDIKEYKKALSDKSFPKYFEVYLKIYLQKVQRDIEKSNNQKDITYLKNAEKEILRMLKDCNRETCNWEAL